MKRLFLILALFTSIGGVQADSEVYREVYKITHISINHAGIWSDWKLASGTIDFWSEGLITIELPDAELGGWIERQYYDSYNDLVVIASDENAGVKPFQVRFHNEGGEQQVYVKTRTTHVVFRVVDNSGAASKNKSRM